MGTALDTGQGGPGIPGAKLPEPGNSLTFAVIDVDNDVPVYKYGTNPPVLDTKADGTPRKQIRLTGLVTAADGAVVGSGDDRRPAQVDELVSIYISSYAKWDPDQDALDKTHKSWSACVDQVGLEVGFVGQWKFLGELPSNGAEPRKDRKFRLRPPKPEEAKDQERYEELHRQQRERTVLVAAGAPAPASEPFPAAAAVDDDF